MGLAFDGWDLDYCTKQFRQLSVNPPFRLKLTRPIQTQQEMGLAFDEWDLDYYTKLFKDMGRDPTNVELFDIAQVRDLT